MTSKIMHVAAISTALARRVVFLAATGQLRACVTCEAIGRPENAWQRVIEGARQRSRFPRHRQPRREVYALGSTAYPRIGRRSLLVF